MKASVSVKAHGVVCARGCSWEAREENQGVMGNANLNAFSSSSS